MAKIFLDYKLVFRLSGGFQVWDVVFDDVSKQVESKFIDVYSIVRWPDPVENFGPGEGMYDQCFGADRYEVIKRQSFPYGDLIVTQNAASCLLAVQNKIAAVTNATAPLFGATAEDTCAMGTLLFVYWYGNLEVGTILYSSETDDPMPYDSAGWFRIGKSAYQIDAAGEVLAIETAICSTEPTLPALPSLPDIAVEAAFHLPTATSVRFVKNAEPVKKTADNTLFAKQRYPGVLDLSFFQTIQKDATLTLQWGSTYDINAIRVVNYLSKAVISTVNANLVQANVNLEATIPGFAAMDPENRGIQIWFPNHPFPDFAFAGNKVNVESTNVRGQFDVISIEDGKGTARGSRVMIINTNSPISQAVPVEVTGKYNRLPYNIYELQLAFNTIGKYELQIALTDEVYDAQSATSEPVEVRADMDEYLSLDYTNDRDEYGCYYGNNIVHKRWIKSRMFQTFAGGEKTINRETSAKLVKLDEYVTKSFEWEIFQIPPYLVTQISLALSHDHVSVNGINVQTEEQLDAEYFLPDPRANASVPLEEVAFTERNIGSGSIDDADSFLIINQGGFIKINP